MNNFFIERIISIKYAVKGFFLLLTTEHAIIAQSVLGIILIFAGFYFRISRTEWMFQLFAMGLVLSVESMNTAVEKLCDFVHPQYHSRIGFIKDISAGAVTFAALFSLIIIVLIYYPHIF